MEPCDALEKLRELALRWADAEAESLWEHGAVQEDVAPELKATVLHLVSIIRSGLK